MPSLIILEYIPGVWISDVNRFFHTLNDEMLNLITCQFVAASIALRTNGKRIRHWCVTSPWFNASRRIVFRRTYNWDISSIPVNSHYWLHSVVINGYCLRLLFHFRMSRLRSLQNGTALFYCRLVSSHDHLSWYILSMSNMMDVSRKNRCTECFRPTGYRFNAQFDIASYKF